MSDAQKAVLTCSGCSKKILFERVLCGGYKVQIGKEMVIVHVSGWTMYSRVMNPFLEKTFVNSPGCISGLLSAIWRKLSELDAAAKS